LEGIAGVGLLPSHYPCPNLSGVANPEFVPLLGQHLLEPLCMPGGFHPHPNWSGKTCIKSRGLTILVLQPTLDDLAGSANPSLQSAESACENHTR